MADISNVDGNEIKDLYESLENLSCMFRTHSTLVDSDHFSPYHDSRSLLKSETVCA